MTLHFSEWQRRAIMGLWLALIAIVLLGYLVNSDFRGELNHALYYLGDWCGWTPDSKCPPGWL